MRVNFVISLALLVLSSFFFANFAVAINYTAANTGNWNVNTTWNPIGIPTNGDTVIIPDSAITVRVPDGYNAACDSITFLGGNQNSRIQLLNATSSLTTGNVTINQVTQNNRTKEIIVGVGKFSANSLNLLGTTSTRRTRLSISTGTATITGDITSAGPGSQIVFSGAGTLNAGGTFLSGIQGGFKASTGTVNFNRTDNQTISPFPYTFNNVTLSGSGIKTLTNATINGVLSVEGTVTCAGTPASYGAKATLRYAGSTAQTTGSEFPATWTGSGGVIIANTSGNAVTLNAAKTINSSLFINAGSIFSTNSTGNYTLNIGANLNINGGTFNANGSTITIGGNWTNTGTFNPATSTVIFNNAGLTSTISGNNAFNNLYCLTANKTINVAAGTTQTANGLFRIDGSAFATRVSLASSSGPGTTWNLVLNGRHDCRYVAVQGSKASGTAYLPINPVAFRNNGDNTNWYDPNLPAEMLFYDNFETSTLASSPPDKPSSNWTISGASWLTEPSNVVTTQNHTQGGSKSMYSRGGSATEGVGVWNNPGWGPQTNCTAEAWFYDDMQSPKKQWLFIDNAAGTRGIGVMTDTTRSTTKYVYCQYLGADIRTVSYIDRTLGWHNVKWIYTETGNTELYLDNVLLLTVTGLDNFSDFDTGTWNWDNSTGSTPMWFDDFMVYRSQAQTRYRWYEDDNAETPTALATENTAVTNRNILTPTRLRLQVQNSQFETWQDAYVTLQYRKGLNGEWRMLGSSEDWNWADGLGTDKAQVANALLTNTNVRQHFVESRPSQANLAMTTGQYGEWDFAITSTSSAALATPYYFRLVVTDPSGAYQRSLAAYTFYPQITLVSPTMTQWTGAVSTAWNVAENWTNGVPDPTKDAIIATTATLNCSLDIAGARCKSLVIQNGRTLTLGTTGTDLTVTKDITVYGNLVQSNATTTLNLNDGNLLIDTTGRYNHSAGYLNASTATIRVINGGQYDISGDVLITANTLNIAVGGLVNVTGAAAFVLQDFTIDLNGQWMSTSTTNRVSISNNFVNNGSMLGSTGGDFRFIGTGKTMSGTSNTTTFYRASFVGSTTNLITNDVRILDALSISPTSSFTASSGNLYVGGNWTNLGTFTHGSGTVILNGTALQIVTAGTSNFYRLVSTNPSAAGVSFADGFTTSYLTNTTANSLMTFAVGQTYNVTAAGGLNLRGSAGNLVSLRSSSAGSQWLINPSGGGWTCDYLDVRDSVNIFATTIFPTNSLDSGNNINWFTADKDLDGLPDYWEYKYYGHLNTNASSDTDSDTLTNILEYEFDNDPTSDISPTKVYVDCDSSYTGMDGSATKPYKYLEDAITAAPAGSMLYLKNGTYSLTNYALSKNLVIVGESPDKTIIAGPYPTGSSSNTGQCLDVTSAKFAVSNITFQDFREEQPVISYSVANSDGLVYLENLKFAGNDTGSKSLIAPLGSQSTTKVYLLNSIFYKNSCAYVAEIKGSPAYVYHNTITANALGGILLSGSGNSNIYNSIIRENDGDEIRNISSGTVSVYNCNIEGGFPGAVDSYDSAENYIDTSLGIFRLASGTPAINKGIQTFLYADFAKIARPIGAAVDLGAFEFDPNDNDGDGLTNAEETANGTNQNHPDSDSDGLSDYEEQKTYSTNPNLADTDGDGIKDGDEPAIGMTPSKYDGILLVDMYDEDFENPARYPQNQHISNSIWGIDGTYSGEIYTETGDSYNSGDNVYINFHGAKPESRAIMLVTRNLLPHHWIAIAYKCARAKLPTNINQALVISGAHFAVNENGRLCAYDPVRKDWIVYNGAVIPDGEWFRVMVHRDHAGKICNVYLDLTRDEIENGVLAFSNLPIHGPDHDLFIRISFSSVSEYDLKIDNMKGYPWDPRP